MTVVLPTDFVHQGLRAPGTSCTRNLAMLEKVNAGRLTSASDRFDFDELVQEDRAHRLIYTDPAIFQAEMTHVFGGTWTYLAHESEIPNRNDFITRRMGLRPLIILRDSDDKIR